MNSSTMMIYAGNRKLWRAIVLDRRGRLDYKMNLNLSDTLYHRGEPDLSLREKPKRNQACALQRLRLNPKPLNLEP